MGTKADYLLLTAYCLLLTAYCLLLATCYLSTGGWRGYQGRAHVRAMRHRAE